ncbi:MAG: hypothetical protein ACRDWX_06630 [Acidimicrobiia bacterium]
MPSYPIKQSPCLDELIHSFSRLLPNPPQRHTHVQQVAGCIQVDALRPDQC